MRLSLRKADDASLGHMVASLEMLVTGVLSFRIYSTTCGVMLRLNSYVVGDLGLRLSELRWPYPKSGE